MTISPESQTRIAAYVREQFSQPSVILCYVSALAVHEPDAALFALSVFERMKRALGSPAMASATDAVEASYVAATVCAGDAK